jgi:hypothetical protein
LGAVNRHAAAARAVEDALAAVAARRSDVAAQLAKLNAEPPPPGAWRDTAVRVGRLTADLARFEDLLHRAEMLGRSVANPAIAAAQRAAVRLGREIVGQATQEACARIRGAIDAHWHHALDVLRPLSDLGDLRRTVQGAIGESVTAAPALVYPAREAWERITDRETPRIEWPVPHPAGAAAAPIVTSAPVPATLHGQTGNKPGEEPEPLTADDEDEITGWHPAGAPRASR